MSAIAVATWMIDNISLEVLIVFVKALNEDITQKDNYYDLQELRNQLESHIVKQEKS